MSIKTVQQYAQSSPARSGVKAKQCGRLMKDRATFVIARPPTIKHADRILVIDQSCIAETGTHAESLRKCGSHYQLYTGQFRYDLSKEYNLLAVMGAALNWPHRLFKRTNAKYRRRPALQQLRQL